MTEITGTFARERAIVLFSGGQDSTTCLAWALTSFADVETIAFDYGQRHAVELGCREAVLAELRQRFPEWRERLGAAHLLPLHVLGTISDTALTRDSEIAIGAAGLPTTFVPGRNLLFLTLAAAVAYRRGIRHIIGGMCETDFAGYPDCRDTAVKAMQVALCAGMGVEFVLHTPLMWLDKAATWAFARQLGGQNLVGLIEEHTHTCYLGERGRRHDWGYGCGTCPACRLRADGYGRFLAAASAATASA